MENLTLRMATPKDAAALCALLQASYPALMASHYENAVLDAVLPFITQSNPHLLASGTYYAVHKTNGQIVGCGGWTMEEPGSGKVEQGLAHIRHFATHPDWTRRGIGRDIFSQCRKDAQSKGVKRFTCYSSLNAEGFYAVMGFAPKTRVILDIKDGTTFPAILMEAKI